MAANGGACQVVEKHKRIQFSQPDLARAGDRVTEGRGAVHGFRTGRHTRPRTLGRRPIIALAQQVALVAGQSIEFNLARHRQVH